MPVGQWEHFCSRLSVGWPWAQPWGLALCLFHAPHSPRIDVHHIFLMVRYKGSCKHVQSLCSCTGLLLSTGQSKSQGCAVSPASLPRIENEDAIYHSFVQPAPWTSYVYAPFFLFKQKTLMSSLQSSHLAHSSSL